MRPPRRPRPRTLTPLGVLTLLTALAWGAAIFAALFTLKV